MDTLTPPPILNAIAEQPGFLTPRPWSRYFQAVRDQVMALVAWQTSLLATTPPPDVGPVSVTGTAETAARGDHTHGIGVSTYTDEQAQDAVGTILTEGPTVEWIYDDALPGILAQVKTQRSILYDANGVMLSGDVLTPGATQLYGTNGAGTKGWYPQPAPFTLGPTLTTIEALTGLADRMIYFTGTDLAALATLTAAGRALIDDADAAAQRTTLGVTDYASGTFTVTATGFSGTVSGTARYARVGAQVVVALPDLTGTSNATTFTLTGMPAGLASGSVHRQIAVVESGAGNYLYGTVLVNGTALTVQQGAASVAWTASGVKSLYAVHLSYLI